MPGNTAWLTGFPGSGKTTLAYEIQACADRPAVVLDGDELRSALPGLGFSRFARAEQVRRTAAIAALLNRQGVSAIVALVSPDRDERLAAYASIRNSSGGAVVEVHVDTSIEECCRRKPAVYKNAPYDIEKAYERPENPTFCVLPWEARKSAKEIAKQLLRAKSNSIELYSKQLVPGGRCCEYTALVALTPDSTISDVLDQYANNLKYWESSTKAENLLEAVVWLIGRRPSSSQLDGANVSYQGLLSLHDILLGQVRARAGKRFTRGRPM